MPNDIWWFLCCCHGFSKSQYDSFRVVNCSVFLVQVGWFCVIFNIEHLFQNPSHSRKRASPYVETAVIMHSSLLTSFSSSHWNSEYDNFENQIRKSYWSILFRWIRIHVRLVRCELLFAREILCISRLLRYYRDHSKFLRGLYDSFFFLRLPLHRNRTFQSNLDQVLFLFFPIQLDFDKSCPFCSFSRSSDRKLCIWAFGQEKHTNLSLKYLVFPVITAFIYDTKIQALTIHAIVPIFVTTSLTVLASGQEVYNIHSSEIEGLLYDVSLLFEEI